MSVASFEANFKKSFEAVFVLAGQIKQYYEIFDGYSNTIDRIVELVNTHKVNFNDKVKSMLKELLAGIQVSLNPTRNPNISLYFLAQNGFCTTKWNQKCWTDWHIISNRKEGKRLHSTQIIRY